MVQQLWQRNNFFLFLSWSVVHLGLYFLMILFLNVQNHGIVSRTLAKNYVTLQRWERPRVMVLVLVLTKKYWEFSRLFHFLIASTLIWKLWSDIQYTLCWFGVVTYVDTKWVIWDLDTKIHLNVINRKCCPRKVLVLVLRSRVLHMVLVLTTKSYLHRVSKKTAQCYFWITP